MRSEEERLRATRYNALKWRLKHLENFSDDEIDNEIKRRKEKRNMKLTKQKIITQIKDMLLELKDISTMEELNEFQSKHKLIIL